MFLIGIILSIISILFFLFWIDLIKKREYITDPKVFWSTLAFILLFVFLSRLCFN